MLIKSELQSILSKRAIRPLKRFGENYLIDANIKDKIIEAAKTSPSDCVLEIGPGFGALTFSLAESGAKVYAVEKDKKVFAVLKEMTKDDYPHLELFCEDILRFDLDRVKTAKKIKVIGNLPYYITTPIIEYLIENRDRIGTAIITVQREVANRLLAEPGTKEYSSISCFVQYYTRPSYIHTVKRTSFYPVPEVDSSLIALEFLPKPSVEVKREELFFKIVRGAFNQRRKAIINSLSREAVLGLSKERLAETLKNAGVDPNTRPESLDLASFARISNALHT